MFAGHIYKQYMHLFYLYIVNDTTLSSVVPTLGPGTVKLN